MVRVTEMGILDEVKKDFVKNLVANGKRPDWRKFDEYRQVKVEKGVLTSAEGSGRAEIGKTQALVGVKFSVEKPYADRPDEGILATNSELLPAASPTFEPGPPDEDSIELARVVDRGIRSSNIIDLKSFFINGEKVLCLYMDIYVLDHDGNLIDASALAAMAAVLNAKMPKIEDDKIVRGEYTGPLKLADKVVATTFGKIGNTILCDTSLDEETAVDARLTISTTSKDVCAMQKGGSGGFKAGEVESLVDLAFQKGNELRRLLE